MDTNSNNSGKLKKRLMLAGIILALLAYAGYEYYSTRPTSTGEPDYDIAYVINMSEHTVTVSMPLGNSKKSVTIQPNDTCEIKKEVESFDIEEWLNSMDTVYLVFDGNVSIPNYRIANNEYSPCEDNLLNKEDWFPTRVLVGTEQKFLRMNRHSRSRFHWGSEEKYRNHYIFVITDATYSDAIDYYKNKKAQ